MFKPDMKLVEKFVNIVKENIDRDGVDKLLKWVESTDFYTAPASTKFHGNYPSGLLLHSIRVYEQLKKKQEDEYDDSIAIVSLFHDLCKVNFYQEIETVDKHGNYKYTYKCNDKFPIGHGEKSVILLLKHIDLTDEEMLCIRWHDARFNNNEVERIAIESVLHKYKLALKLMQADQEAAYWFNE